MSPLTQSPPWIDRPFTPGRSTLECFACDGFARIPGLLDADRLLTFEPAITAAVEAHEQTRSLTWEQRDRYQRAFVQVMNLWRRDAAVRSFVFSRRLASTAARLLQVPAVRLYHDQALYKEPQAARGQNDSPWHVDQYYWPLSTPDTLTAWIPLQSIDETMGPLEFAAGSHQRCIGRDREMDDQSALWLDRQLDDAGCARVCGPFAAGEVSFHRGWTFHRAGANRSETMRKVMTIIYVADGATVAEPTNPYQQNDLETWLPGMHPGDPVASELNPLLFEEGTE